MNFIPSALGFETVIAEKGFSILAIEADWPDQPAFIVTYAAPPRTPMQMWRFRVSPISYMDVGAMLS